jgi:hypothetical protein
MNEPIENLIANMSHLSRPMSSNQPFASNKDYLSNRMGVGSSHAYSRKKIGQPSMKALKKERAMTAHNKLNRTQNRVGGDSLALK